MKLKNGTDCTTAAANIRTELRATLPGVKFSVRSSRFSMGDSVDIEWTDGPSVSEVRAIVGKYQAGSFDGSTDSYDYSLNDFHKAHGSTKFVTLQRDNSSTVLINI